MLFLCHGLDGRMGWGGKEMNMRKEGIRSVPMNLQLFADGGTGAGGDSGGTGGAGGGTPDGGNDGVTGGTDDGKDKKTEPPTFDDLLKSGHQAEFDRRLQKGIDTALTKAQGKWRAMTDDKLSEAEKLVKMTKDEKAEYLRQKEEKVLTAREANVTKRELMAEAKNTLAERKLPVGLAEVLNYTDAETCSKSMDAVEKAFQEAVKAAVEDKLKGGEPLKKAPSEQEKDLAKQVENLMMGIA